MNNNWKRHFDIDSDPLTDQVFTLLDAVQSDNEDEADQLMNDFDTEFIAPAEIELTDNQDNVSALTLEANVHVVDQGTTHEITKDKQKDKKRQKKVPPITWKRNISSHSLKRIAFLRAELPTNLTKVLQLSIYMNKLLILMFWLRYVYACSKKQPLFVINLEEVLHQCLRNESYHWCHLHHDCKPIAKYTNVLGLQSFCR